MPEDDVVLQPAICCLRYRLLRFDKSIIFPEETVAFAMRRLSHRTTILKAGVMGPTVIVKAGLEGGKWGPRPRR